MATLRLESVTKLAPSASSSTIVDNISFTVPDGAFWVLVGPSGCGKSTILRLIAGLLPVSSGQILIGDQPVNALSARQRDVAMVFQNYALYPHMTVAQNLGFGLKMRGLTAAVRSQKVADMAAALGLSELLDRKPAQLSGGQQQRVALGRALVRQPRIFLLDEPLSNLDTQLREQTRAELKQLHQQFGVTTLYVTHDQNEAMTLADELIVLDRGKVQQIGPPLQVYDAPQNVAVASFLGTPAMNLLTVQSRRSQIWLGTQPIARWADADIKDDTLLTLGIRPEQVQLHGAGLPLEVVSIEPLGREVLVRGQLPDGQSLLFFVPAQQRLRIGETCRVALCSPGIIFNRETGDRLTTVEYNNETEYQP